MVRVRDVQFGYLYGARGQIRLPDFLFYTKESVPMLHQLRGGLPTSSVIST